jgi:hypothetical protein
VTAPVAATVGVVETAVTVADEASVDGVASVVKGFFVAVSASAVSGAASGEVSGAVSAVVSTIVVAVVNTYVPAKQL